MRACARLLPLVLTAAVALGAPAAASASTFCVGTTAGPCLASYPATGDGLQSALDAADLNADIGGTPDTVRIGPGTYARSGGAGFLTKGGSDLFVEGSGPSTVLTRTTGGGGGIMALKPGGGSSAGASLSNVVAYVRFDMSETLQGFRNYSDIRVTGPGAPTVAVRVEPGGRLSRAVIDPASFRMAATAVVLNGSSVEDTVIRLRRQGTPMGAVFGVVAGGTASISDNTVRHVTILGDGAPLTFGVSARGYPNTDHEATAFTHIRDTVIRGAPIAIDRTGDPARTVGSTTYYKSTAYLDVRYSSLGLAPGQRTESGPGDLTLLPGNLNDPDPLLDAGARPLAGSPLIDAGDPGAPLTVDSPTDAGGGERIVGGRRDIGAYEYVPRAPLIAVPGTPRPPASATDRTAPVISAASLSPARFRVGKGNTATAAARRKRAKATGTKLRLTLSEAATVRLAVQRRLPGRAVRKRGAKRRACVRPTRRNSVRANPRCRRYAKAKTLTRRLGAGRRSVEFTGRIAGRPLAPGSYRLTLTARDAAGNASKPRALAFTILR